MSKKEAKVKAVMELPKAVSYIADIVESLKAGQVSITNGAESLTLEPPQSIKLEFAAAQKADRESISLKISWRKEEVSPEEVDLKIAAGAAAADAD